MQVASDILDRAVAALAGAVQTSDSVVATQHSGNQNVNSRQPPSRVHMSPDSVSELCRVAEAQCPGCSAGFWEMLGREIAAAHREMAAVRNSLTEAECGGGVGSVNRDQCRELELLAGLSSGCVHVGVALSQLLLPTTVDPVSMAETHYHCHQLLVSAVI